jgi:hypothetical protein
VIANVGSPVQGGIAVIGYRVTFAPNWMQYFTASIQASGRFML